MVLTTAGFGLGFILGVPVHERSLFAPDFPAFLRNPGNPEAMFTTARPLSTLRPDEIQKELTFLLTKPQDSEINRRLNILFSRWSRLEPSAAFLEAARLRAERGQDGPIWSTMWVWVETEPTTATQWAINLPQPDSREFYTRQMFYCWGERDPDMAAAHIASLPASPAQAVAAKAIVPSFFRNNPKGCRKWMDLLPPGTQTRTIPTLAAEWTKQDPTAAAAWALTLTPTELQSSALREAGSAWAQRDGPAALAYGVSLPDGPGKESFLNAAIRAYVSIQPGDAAGWLAGHAAQPFFERLAKEMTSQWLQFDPPACADWVVSLPDQPQREKILQDLVNQWKKTDPDSAAQFVGSHPSISADFKSRNLMK